MKHALQEYYTAHENRSLDANIRRKITVLSFVFSVGMILYHATPRVSFSNIVNGNAVLDFLSAFCESLGGLGLSFFFLVSAFLLYYNLSYGNLRAKLTRRIHTLAIPFGLWNLIMYFLRGFHHIGTDRFLLNVLISKYADWFWFVGALMLLAAAAPVCLMVFRNRYVGAGIVVALFVFAELNWFGVGGLFPKGLNVDRFLYYVPIYFTGVYLGVHGYDIINGERCPVWLRGVAALLLIASYALPHGAVTYLLTLLRAILVWLILPNGLFHAAPKWWQQLSFYTYATHVFLLTALKDCLRLVESIDYNVITVGNALLWRLAISAATFLMILVSAWLLIRFMPKAYAVLTGGRVPKLSDDNPAQATPQ